MVESIKQKSLIIEHLLYTDENSNYSKMLNESSLTSHSGNNIKCLNEENKKKIESDSKSCNEVYASNAANSGKKNKLVGFFTKIFK